MTKIEEYNLGPLMLALTGLDQEQIDRFASRCAVGNSSNFDSEEQKAFWRGFVMGLASEIKKTQDGSNGIIS
jgi:hypothetical protein